jgi:hypothetical protein
MEKSPAARYARAAELGRDLKSIKADLPVPPEPATLLMDRTVIHTPTAPPVESGSGANLGAFAARLRDLHLGRAQLAALVLLAALVVGSLGWYFWPTKQAQSKDTTNTTPKAPVTTTVPIAASTKEIETPPVSLPPVTLALLRVNSRPSAAKILIDGHDTGKTTPAQIPIELSRPPARVQFEMTGFKTADVSITPDALRSGTINVSLSPREAAPRLTLVATGDYKFDVMDRQRVLSPASERHDVLVSGLRSIQLRSDRYFLDQTVRVDRVEGSTVKASAPPLGSITVYASGALEDCRVFIDDRILDSGSLPILNRDIASGAHRVKLSCTRGETDAQTINVLPHQNASTRFPASTPVRPR